MTPEEDLHPETGQMILSFFFTHWPLGDVVLILQVYFANSTRHYDLNLRLCICRVTTILMQEEFVLNSLAPGRFEWNFRHVLFKLMFVIDGWGILCEIALIWMSLDFTDDQSTLVQVMAWSRQAPSHYLSQCPITNALGYEALPEPMLTQISVAIWCH